MDYHKFDDEALLRLIAHSQSEALSELYDRYHRLVFSLALNTVLDYATAEEITPAIVGDLRGTLLGFGGIVRFMRAIPR